MSREIRYSDLSENEAEDGVRHFETEVGHSIRIDVTWPAVV
jgi:hypothetical protein